MRSGGLADEEWVRLTSEEGSWLGQDVRVKTEEGFKTMLCPALLTEAEAKRLKEVPLPMQTIILQNWALHVMKKASPPADDDDHSAELGPARDEKGKRWKSASEGESS